MLGTLTAPVASLAVLALLVACASTTATAPPPTGDLTVRADDGSLIFHGGTVITMDPTHPEATALRVAAGRVTHVLDAVPDDLPGQRIDLGGAFVLPGLVDAHLHLRGIGAAARKLDLKGTESAEAVVALVAAAAAEAPPGTWIRGRGWDQNDWTVTEFPTHALLDAAAPEHPVWLTRVDGHAVWVNQRALDLAALTAETADPDGGEILRDADGQPTGVLIDEAISLVSAQLPSPTDAEIRADYERGIALCQAAGLTGVHDMGVGTRSLAQLRAIEADGGLGLRVTVYLSGDESELAPLLAEGPDREGLVQVVGVKLFADGALGSRGAALLEPYSDRPDTSGLLQAELEELTERARGIHDAGFQLAIHAIGDRGNRVALDAIAAAQGESTDRRHRIEHAQIVHPDDISRFAELGVVASMQPTHATSDMPWAEARLGPDRLEGAYAWRGMLDAGALVAFGSDAPVEGHSPWLGVYSAVTRQDHDGQPEGGWLPDQRLEPSLALALFTAGPARAAHNDDGGVIRVGSAADVTAVRSDPRTMDVAALHSNSTVWTVVEGRVVFASGQEIR